MSIWRWSDKLEPVPPEARVTLGEGGTPLVRSRRIGPAAGLGTLLFKLETCNPTGSYKDRFAAAAVSHMLARGRSCCVATSSGNTGAALAAYCAAAGVRCRIAIVESAPAEKLRQMRAYGAELCRVRGFGLDPAATRATFAAVERMGAAPGAAVQISAYRYSPAGMTGVQTLGYELAAGRVDHVFCPAGGGGLALAVARGLRDTGPAVECVQPSGNDTMATPLREGAAKARPVPCTTAISGLQVPDVIDGDDAIAACRASGGSGHVVSDGEVWEAQARLAREEGIYAEPAGATALAGALRARREGRLRPDAVVVCLVTGSGFKDPASVDRMLEAREVPLLGLEEFEARFASG